MKTFFDRHRELENEVENAYGKAISKKLEVQLYNKDLEDEVYELPEINYIDDNGYCRDGYIMDISKERELHLAYSLDTNQEIYVNFNSLSNLFDKIAVLDIVESFKKK